jgi:hypothetical protein
MCCGHGLHTLCVMVADAARGSQLWSLPCVLWWWVRHVGCRCGLHTHGMGPRSLLMRCVCCSCGLPPVCCGRRCGSWSSCVWHGAVVAVNAARALHCGLCVSWSLHMWHGAMVAVDVAHASHCGLYVSWSQVRHIVLQSWVPSLWRVHCGCCLCVVCCVAVALFTPHGVLPVPSLRQVWCCGSHKRGGDRAARRDAAMWRTQQGRVRQGGGMSALSLWLVITGRFT